ncbi:MAG: transcriptional regulator [Bacteroidetes bacterium HGW-Bacteroidetes-21]|jgi:ribosome-binding protein aMBF1 (putative translation factor)|nr:MAG: transcriptional regulator [Bacteroidetes bacterium HGW-Bacteroidetes-21]
MKNKNSNLNDWKNIKDKQFGRVGTKRRDQLDREVRTLKIGLMLRQARESKNMTQEDLAKVIEKKRTYISRVENDGSNMTLKTLLEIVERGLGGKVTIGIEI